MSAAATAAGAARAGAGLPWREFSGHLGGRRARRDHPLPRDRGEQPADPAPTRVYLIDPGAQYVDGTTDITRTIWTGPSDPPSELRERVTRVMKGHIAIATLAFPEGVGGAHLDAFARRALWQVGLDYDHGTGHGVGSYLSVHEGPVSLSRLAAPVPIAAGMILSNEPGYYLPRPVRHPAGKPVAGAAG